MKEIYVVDSHTGGEPTRVIVSGGPELGRGSVAQRLQRFRTEHDRFRSAMVNEPRGSDVLVGALLLDPEDPKNAAGVIFFNNVGYLGMCGHGTIGVIVTLAHLGQIKPGTHHLETPVGTVTAQLGADGTVAVDNVPSYRKAKAVTVRVPGIGNLTGDVAWGGNWFFLVDVQGRQLNFTEVEKLTNEAWAIRQAVNEQGFPEVDHIELVGPPQNPSANARNFVLCPGKAYDRSPCGTGTSAKLACLYADGKLKEREVWRQESITGSLFEGWVKVAAGELIPTIKGSAYVNGEAKLILNPADPCCWGIAVESHLGAGAS